MKILKNGKIWGRKNHRIVYENLTPTFSSDQLRFSLEEALLVSVHHKTILNRINSLRQQKIALQNNIIQKLNLRSSKNMINLNNLNLHTLVTVVLSSCRIRFVSFNIPILGINFGR